MSTTILTSAIASSCSTGLTPRPPPARRARPSPWLPRSVFATWRQHCFSRTWYSYSSRNFLSVDCGGAIAASPKGHSVLPPIESVTPQQRFEVLLAALAVLDLVEQPQHPARALATGRALAARFVLVEVGQALRHPDHAHRVVHDDGARRAEHRAGLRRSQSKSIATSISSASARASTSRPEPRRAACAPPRMPPPYLAS